MAPRKEKAERVSADAAADTILNYLRKQNRPYSATDISANLHNKVTKAAAAKILKDLHERKEIEGRAAGKQIVYHAIQDPSSTASPEQLAEIDATIASLRAETAAALTTAKSLRASLTSLNTTLSTTELRAAVAAQERERAELLGRLGALRAGEVRPVGKGEREEVEREWGAWRKVSRARERIAGDLWGLVEESLPEGVDKAELRERLGLDE
ncbi:Tat binding protein 1-interacting [Cenococcum geophilum 1.58]|uniref:Tat binding protein 1-interacting n=1 Tax=Cenococcum geophilum 1.58 TaxID=794803 RepID=A0ACC8ELQ0_9PEZI|nr:Tat binding protein 1-interacting [Cenococcum geophilum 1.58]